MIVLNDTLGAYGGSHTLMLRMCQWLHEQQIRTAVFCTSDANTEIVGKIRACGISVYKADLQNTVVTGDLLRSLLEQEPVTVVNFIWNYYLDLELLKKKTGLKFSNLIYTIHEGTFKKGIDLHQKLLKSYMLRNYGTILERMNRNRAVYMMDVDVLASTQSYFGTVLEPRPPILPLPMFCREREDRETLIRQGFDSNLLMTASRAEFPYKGYLLALIDDFAALKKNHPSLKLEMVAGGLEEDVAVLREKIAALPESCRKDVIFHDWMDYDILKKKMEHCRLFIGMGTSVLDAALVYKPAIPVKYNTMKNLADHFLSECPQMLCAEENCCTPAINLLEKTLKMPYEEYHTACLESFRQVKQYYDIDQTMRCFLSADTPETGCLLTGGEAQRYHLHNVINRKFRKISDRFEYTDIKVESGKS